MTNSSVTLLCHLKSSFQCNYIKGKSILKKSIFLTYHSGSFCLQSLLMMSKIHMQTSKTAYSTEKTCFLLHKYPSFTWNITNFSHTFYRGGTFAKAGIKYVFYLYHVSKPCNEQYLSNENLHLQVLESNITNNIPKSPEKNAQNFCCTTLNMERLSFSWKKINLVIFYLKFFFSLRWCNLVFAKLIAPINVNFRCRINDCVLWKSSCVFPLKAILFFVFKKKQFFV